jgi:hypothetical protein
MRSYAGAATRTRALASSTMHISRMIRGKARLNLEHVTRIEDFLQLPRGYFPETRKLPSSRRSERMVNSETSCNTATLRDAAAERPDEEHPRSLASHARPRPFHS